MWVDDVETLVAERFGDHPALALAAALVAFALALIAVLVALRSRALARRAHLRAEETEARLRALETSEERRFQEEIRGQWGGSTDGSRARVQPDPVRTPDLSDVTG